MSNFKKPTVKLSGINGNAFSVMTEVQRGLEKADAPPEHIINYIEEAMSGDYNNLLRVSMKYVDVI